MGCPALDVLHLKVGAPIMLLANMTPTLVNGLRGNVIDMKQKSVVVHFPSLDVNTELHFFTFSVYDCNIYKDVVCRKKFHLNWHMD